MSDDVHQPRIPVRGPTPRAEHTDDIEGATVAAIRGLLARDLQAQAQAQAHGQALLRDPATLSAGHLAVAIVAYHQSSTVLAWAHLADLPRPLWRAHAAAEMFGSAFACDRDRARLECDALLYDGRGAGDSAWHASMVAAHGAGDDDLVTRLVEAWDAADAGAPELPDRERQQLEWLLAWVRRAPGRAAAAAAAPPRPGVAVLGILDYEVPDATRAQTNLGDYVQSLAALGHIVRHNGATFEGPGELPAAMGRFQRRVRRDRRVAGPSRPVHVIPVNRDCSSLTPVPAGTWLLAFGWYMAPLFERRWDFPFHPNVRPIFVSFHIQRRALLSPAAIEYLRLHAPIGCRDWTTVYLLLGEDIPAFFSGCLTSTIDTLFEPQDAACDGRVAAVDARLSATEQAAFHADPLTHRCEALLDGDLATNLDAAVTRLEAYRHDYSRIITSRLHCYLPAVALGIDVDFRPDDRADIRLDGLADLAPGDARLASMQAGLLTKLAAVIAPILDCMPESDVYAIWRDVCADDVQRARAALRADEGPLPVYIDVAESCRRIRAREQRIAACRRRHGAPVHIALAVDASSRDRLPVLVDRLVVGTARPVALWILTRGLPAAGLAGIASTFPEAAFTLLPCDGLEYGASTGMGRHANDGALDRLLLPELLPELERVAFLDMDTLVLGDVAELYDIGLDGTPLAARRAIHRDGRSGLELVYRAARRLAPGRAACLRRSVHARLGGEFPGLDVGVLVLDLALMRSHGFCDEFVPFVARYALGAEEIFNLYVGSGHKVLPDAWNFWPSMEVCDDPKLVHWAGPARPWLKDDVAFADVWRASADRLPESRR